MILDVLAEVARALDDAQVPWMLAGSHASTFHGDVAGLVEAWGDRLDRDSQQFGRERHQFALSIAANVTVRPAASTTAYVPSPRRVGCGWYPGRASDPASTAKLAPRSSRTT